MFGFDGFDIVKSISTDVNEFRVVFSDMAKHQRFVSHSKNCKLKIIEAWREQILKKNEDILPQ
jgi:hypothetical protein